MTNISTADVSNFFESQGWNAGLTTKDAARDFGVVVDWMIEFISTNCMSGGPPPSKGPGPLPHRPGPPPFPINPQRIAILSQMTGYLLNLANGP
jgi:hypothetical protein